MGYVIYGKRTKEVVGGGPDARFAALNFNGVRVSRLSDAAVYETREDAENMLKAVRVKEGTVFEIRKR